MPQIFVNIVDEGRASITSINCDTRDANLNLSPLQPSRDDRAEFCNANLQVVSAQPGFRFLSNTQQTQRTKDTIMPCSGGTVVVAEEMEPSTQNS